ncbi:unnamed protein product [Durusdinium trenchii]|uniref:SET domain-containing protein n=1 Tax=Durusdinium trenchii TaxID=1381693 RepID=A0ABP0I7P3_9DINO
MTFMTSTPLMASPPPRPAPRPPRLRSGGLLPSGRSGLRLRRSSSQVLLPLLTLQACRRSVPAPRRGLEALSLDTKPRAQAQEQQLAAFRAWLKEGNAAVQSRGVRLQRSPLGGLGLFAQKNFPQVDAHHFDLDDATVLQPILARAAEEYDVDAFVEVEAQKAVLALCQRLLLERQQGASSKFAEYLAVIPDPSELHPLQLRWPKRLSEQSALLSRMHHTVLERDNACMEALQPFEQVWKRRCWALNAVWTRAVHLVGAEGEERLSLVPLMDFMNHWTPTRSTSETWSCFYEIASDHLAVRAERAISKGEELTLLYGEFSDAQLLCNYGICPEMPCRTRKACGKMSCFRITHSGS